MPYTCIFGLAGLQRNVEGTGRQEGKEEEMRGDGNWFINFFWYNFTDVNEHIIFVNSENVFVKIRNKNNYEKSQFTDYPYNLAYIQMCFLG